MPEGDTIFKLARRLESALAGQAVVAVGGSRLPMRRPRAGETVTGAEARGKHLLLHFSGGLALHTHMKMTGTWRVTASRPRDVARARVVVEVEGAVACCYDAPTIEVLASSAVDDHPAIAALGPDLCRADIDTDAAAERFTLADADGPVAVALLDQRVACGVGNVYRSEVLHACGVDPFQPLRDVDAETRCRLLATASQQLRANLDGGPRRTTASGLAVYDRARKPCRRCGRPIDVAKIGTPERAVYWCAACQR